MPLNPSQILCFYTSTFICASKYSNATIKSKRTTIGTLSLIPLPLLSKVIQNRTLLQWKAWLQTKEGGEKLYLRRLNSLMMNSQKTKTVGLLQAPPQWIKEGIRSQICCFKVSKSSNKRRKQQTQTLDQLFLSITCKVKGDKLDSQATSVIHSLKRNLSYFLKIIS